MSKQLVVLIDRVISTGEVDTDDGLEVPVQYCRTSNPVDGDGGIYLLLLDRPEVHDGELHVVKETEFVSKPWPIYETVDPDQLVQ